VLSYRIRRAICKSENRFSDNKFGDP